MSREIKLVPEGFDWPLDKVWEGYVMPENLTPLKCVECDGSGCSPEVQELYDRWYGKSPFRPEERGSTPFLPDGPEAKAWAERQIGRAPEYYGTGVSAHHREAVRICSIWNRQWAHHLNEDDVKALIEADRLYDLTHRWDDTERKWIPTGKIPTAAEVNSFYLFGFGHDAINAWKVVKAEAIRLGAPPACKHCDGDGHIFRDDEHRKLHDEWESTEPPRGNCVQLWETTSEGSPISPPFHESEDLAQWLAENGVSAFAGETCSKEEWLAMIRNGHSIASMVSVGGVPFNGVEAVSVMGES